MAADSHNASTKMPNSVMSQGTKATGHPEPIVRFVSVEKSYDGENLVISDLNLSVRNGEFLTMLGPSGSGKTTCLMMLAGFEAATGGEIYLNGNPINAVPPYKRGIGMVFQNYALFPHMTVAENSCLSAGSAGCTQGCHPKEDWGCLGNRCVLKGTRPDGQANCLADNSNGWPWQGR